MSTTEAGCRIYATGTIFLQGQLTYTGTSSLQNLQLSSARKKEVVNATSPPVPGFTSP